MGSISIGQSEPVVVYHEGSVCAIWNVNDTDEVRQAGIGLIEAIQQGDREPLIIFVNQLTATVLALTRAKVMAARDCED